MKLYYAPGTCSLAPMILAAIPVCASYVGEIWSIVATVIAVGAVHRVSGGRAVLAVLWPLMLVLGLGIVLMLVLVATSAM